MRFHELQIPPPRSWEQFEDLCLDLFRHVWNDPTAQKNGRRGQAQHGTDIVGQPNGPQGQYYGVQCKGKDALYSAIVTETALRAEVEKAKRFSPPLAQWILVTTAPKDALLEKVAREITAEHRAQDLFGVKVLGWEDLRSLIACYPDVIERHYPEHAPSRGERLDSVAALLSQLAGSTPLPAAQFVTPTEGNIEAIERAFGNVSRVLLGWPQETDGQWIERPELERMHALAGQPETNIAVLLGGPGEGKSALLARLGNRLARDGSVLLGIKADQVPRSVATLAELDRWVGCPVSVTTALRQLAADRRVVLLIDQLDALADLMDERSERLSALLQLVGLVAGTPNLQVVLSCREFEFRHDVRLTTRKAEVVTLARLSWEQVEPLVIARGLDPRGWSNEVRDVLRTPQHLAVFLRHFAGELGRPIFNGYHGLLDQVLGERLQKRYGRRTIEAAERIAIEMAEEEELWLARDRFDREFGDELKNLEAAGFVVLSENRLSLTFRHQTLFDFLRARAFLRYGLSIADHVIKVKQESLFVRPTLWSALHYLRGTDPAQYRREFGRLWAEPGLRLHLKYLLIAFLGEVNDPSDEEAGWLLPALEDPALRARVLRAMSGRRGWFSRMLSRLPSLMRASAPEAAACAGLLRAALSFERNTVLDIVERYWLPEETHLGRAFHVLEAVDVWDDRSAALAFQIADNAAVGTFWIRGLAAQMSQRRGDLAAGLVVRHLQAKLRRILTARPPRPDPSDFSSAEQTGEATRGVLDDEVDLGALTQLLEDNRDWHGLDKVVANAPKEFIERAWPILIAILERLADAEPRFTNQYRRHFGLWLERDRPGHEGPFAEAVEAAILGFAGADVEGFCQFIVANKNRDLIIVHHLLMLGLNEIAPARPGFVVEYLLEDPRRFAVGDAYDIHRGSRALIAAVAPALESVAVARLERAVMTWQPYRNTPVDEDAATRRSRLQWAREHRLRLLRGFPRECLSPPARRHLEMEERALPDVRDYDHAPFALIQTTRSRMSAAQMAKAGDDEIVGLFEELVDDTGWSSELASREFAEFAKGDPQRAFGILDRFEPRRQERPAGQALAALSGSPVPPSLLIARSHDLAERGFASNEFKAEVARCLREVADRGKGLDDKTCELLESWLTQRTLPQDDGEPEGRSGADEQRADRESGSLLWGGGYVTVSGDLNYTVLIALMCGYLRREPGDADGWLAVLERHLACNDSVRVWKALGDDLRYAAAADRHRSVTFFATLLERHPGILRTARGVRLIASIYSVIPAALLKRVLTEWVSGEWARGPQAAGEVAAFVLCHRPDDAERQAGVGMFLAGGDHAPAIAEGLRLGVAHTVTRGWQEPSLREVTTPLLLELIPGANGRLAEALQSLLGGSAPIPADDYTRQILEALLRHPAVLMVRNGGNVVERLKELLREVWNPELVHAVAEKLIETAGPGLGDITTAWAGNAKDLVEIALTLHRLPGTRARGLDLFERLMTLDAYGVQESLSILDRHPFR